MISGKAAVVGLIGWPVAHSLSPRLHQHWIEQYQLDALYAPFPVAPENIKDVIKALPKMGICGCNVTIPHKELIIPHVHMLDDSAQKIGAVNVLVIDEQQKICGHNTDAYGFIENVRMHYSDFKSHSENVLVIGAGGASSAIIYALKETGAKQIVITNRTASKAQAQAQKFDIIYGEWENITTLVSQADWIINTTSLGMKGKDPLPFACDAIQKDALICDIVYAPLMTPLLSYAKSAGNPFVTGIGMLAFQAAKSFELWFGIAPDVDADLLQQMNLWAQDI